jgi:hypothetical protein
LLWRCGHVRARRFLNDDDVCQPCRARQLKASFGSITSSCPLTKERSWYKQRGKDLFYWEEIKKTKMRGAFRVQYWQLGTIMQHVRFVTWLHRIEGARSMDFMACGLRPRITNDQKLAVALEIQCKEVYIYSRGLSVGITHWRYSLMLFSSDNICVLSHWLI